MLFFKPLSGQWLPFLLVATLAQFQPGHLSYLFTGLCGSAMYVQHPHLKI